MIEKYTLFAQRLVDKEELFAPGHRACQGCGETIAVRLVLKVLGKNTIVVCATGCLEIISSCFPTTSWRIPWIHTLFENVAAVASGIEAGLKAKRKKYSSVITHHSLLPKVVGMAGDGGTADIGIQALSGALERGHNMLYICYDNEAYMNTGIQRSSTTPYGAWSTTSPPGKVSIGQKTWKKNMPEIACAHNIPYVATACISYPFDLMEKVKKAKAINGPSYIHILCPCPPGWRFPSNLTIKLGKLAVESGAFPLYEVEEGNYKLSFVQEELRPIKEYLQLQGRFRHLKDEDINQIQKRVKEEYKKLINKSRLQ